MKFIKKEKDIFISDLKKEKKNIYKDYYSYKKSFVMLANNSSNFSLLEEQLNKMADCITNLTRINFVFISNVEKGIITCKNIPESSMFEYCNSVRKYAISEFKNNVFEEKLFEISKLSILLSFYDDDIVDDDVVIQMMYFISQKIELYNALIGDKFNVDDTIYYRCLNLIYPEKVKVKQL